MKSNHFIFFFVALFMLNCCAKKTTMTVGQKAPNFSLVDVTGKSYSLSDFRGKKLALYFYPKAGTPYCRREACSLRDNFSTLKKKGITIIGISSDSRKNLKNFLVRYNLPFLLLSDPNQSVIKAYGAKGLFFNKRKTFLINEQEIVVAIITKVDVDNHAQQIIDGFASIEKR